MTTRPHSSKGLVLITGINGYVASTTAKKFIDAGWNVRGTARSVESSVELLRPSLGEHLDSGRLEIAHVPDITTDGCMDVAVAGINVLAHLAAPVSFKFKEAKPIIHAAVRGTETVLDSALRCAGPQLHTAIFMSSLAAVVNMKEAPYQYTEADWADGPIEQVKKLGDEAGGQNIYCTSKALAERAFWDFGKKHKPGWKMAAVNPALIHGPPLNLPKDPSKLHETIIDYYKALKGEDIPELSSVAGYADVRDVARVHLWIAEHPEKADGQRFLVASGFNSRQKILDVLNKHYPQRKGTIQVGEPGKGYIAGSDEWPEGKISMDISKVPKATGEPWITMEQSIVDTARAFERYL